MATHTEAARRSEPNRLIDESSPYLLQHAYNPVDWYPWGAEALARARELDRPIFLSIGYSACHWCHVMEHESFENGEIAAFMNEHFINVKVDREERPDLDQIYMNAVQLMTHRGGWPMSVFLTPDLKPFYGGTYWPPAARMGMPGFLDILKAVDEAWRTRRQEIDSSAQQLTDAVVQVSRPQGEKKPLDDSLLRKAAQSLRRSTDRTHGGFGRAPKFPHPMDLRVLLRAWKRFGDEDALSAARLTLDRMAAGGIYDHLGGGFHRYSTDERWLVPHFEKMLYDNALLVPAYLEAYQATGEQDYLRVVRETLDYVLREMTQTGGGFYSTQDADSEGEEGKFYIWEESDILELLGPEDGRVFCYCYDVTQNGNWEGTNILNRPKSNAQAARVLGLDAAELVRVLDRCKQRLYNARAERVWPARDDKVLVSWNGLMISALAMADQVLNEPRYRGAARRTADFILNQVRQPDGGLWHSYKDGVSRINAFLDDYACLINGLIDVYESTFEAGYLESALDLSRRMIDEYYDEQAGGFFYTSRGHEALIARPKDVQDSATPSGNSMAATALLRLGRLCGRSDLEEMAEKTLDVLSPVAGEYVSAAGQALLALDFLLGPAFEVAIIAGDRDEETRTVLDALYRRFVPNKVVALKEQGMTDENLPAALEPLLKGKATRNGAPTVYLCEHGTCGMPVIGATGLEEALQARS